MKTKRTNANKSVLICIVESPDLRDFFLASSTKARKENPVASLGCFSASDLANVYHNIIHPSHQKLNLFNQTPQTSIRI